MGVVDAAFGQPMKPEEHASMTLAGGIVQQGYQCGMLWGAALAAGAQAYRQFGPGPLAETKALLAAQQLVETFRQRNREINCAEITELNWKTAMKSEGARQLLKFFLKGGPVGCFAMAARYAPLAYSQIDATLSANHTPALAGPVSCAALLAQAAGLSDLHTTMAAGLAGGIGLSGGGCGALGAAIWISEMRTAGESPRGMDFSNPRSQAIIEAFLKSAGYEFECAGIVGRRFESVADHAAYVQAGGCAPIIATLAASVNPN